MRNLFVPLTILALALACAPAQAQRLGGLPDRSFNPADDGKTFYYANRAQMRFYPGPGRSLWCEKNGVQSTLQAPRAYQLPGQYGVGVDGRQIEVAPGKYLFVFRCLAGDSIAVAKYNEGNPFIGYYP